MANYTRKAVRGAGIVLGMTAASYFLGYVFRILIARFGTSAYGLEGVDAYGLVYGLIGFYGLFSVFTNLGLRSAMVTYIAKYRIQDKPEKTKAVIIIVSAATFLLSVLIFSPIIIFSDWLAINYFKIPQVSILIKIYGVGVIFSSLALSLRGAFISFQEMGNSSSIDLVKSIVTTSLLAILLYMGFYKEDAAVISFTAAYIVFLPLIYIPILLKKTFPAFLRTKAEITKELTKKLFKFGALVSVTDFSAMVLGYTDTVILTYFRSLGEVALYNAAFPTMKLVNVIAIAITQVLFPMSAELWVKGQKEQLSTGLGLLYKYALVVVFPITLLIFLFPETILRTLFGEEFVPAANILRIFAVGYFLQTFTTVNNSTLTGIGKPRDVGRIAVTSAAVNITLNFILIPYYGIEGAAIADVSGFIVAFMLSTTNLRRHVSIALPWRDFTVTATAGVLITCLVYYVKTLEFLGPGTKLAFSVAAAGLLYVSLLFLFRTLTHDDLKKIIRKVR